MKIFWGGFFFCFFLSHLILSVKYSIIFLIHIKEGTVCAFFISCRALKTVALKC